MLLKVIKLLLFICFFWIIIPYNIYKFITEQRKRKMINKEYKEFKQHQKEQKESK